MRRSTIASWCDGTIVAGILALAFILPFETDFLPGETGTDGARNGAMILALAGWIGRMISEKRVLARRTPLDGFVAAYLAVCIVSACFAIDRHGSFRLLRKDILTYLLMYYVAVGSIRDPRRARWIAWTVLAGGAVVCLYSTANFAWRFFPDGFSDGRLKGTFDQPNRYAQYLIVLGAFIMAAFLASDRAYRKALLLLFLAICALNLFWTGSRAGWVAFAAMLAVFGLKLRGKVLLILALAVGALVAGVLATPMGRARLHVVGDERLWVYPSALAVVRDYPILGIGYGDVNFKKAYRERYRSDKARTVHSGTHNVFLQAAVETGLIGLVAFIALHLKIFAVGFRTFRTARDPWSQSLALACLAALTGVFAIGQLHTLYRDRNVHVLWMAIALLVILHLGSNAVGDPPIPEAPRRPESSPPGT
ncbi:O-antigen ligase family protein [Candidatus Sumerlaeota bacterium]|nr:O-antigen ligase family protein [Candidatus Sumerlaeota bacterium]